MLRETITQVTPLLQAQGRLIRLPDDLPVVFVGDTHGDRTATERVLERFPIGDHRIVFLGDTVDRGPDSIGNLDRILRSKLSHPDRVTLLMGNHEAWGISPFTPADFWNGLAPEDEAALAGSLIHLPLAAWHPAGVLAVHGALPAVASLEAIASIAPGSSEWRALTWGDWVEDPETLGPRPASRPAFGRKDFDERSTQLGVRVLVRSHQARAPRLLFDRRCLTIFTSVSYGDGRRRVARLAAGIRAASAADLEIIDLE